MPKTVKKKAVKKTAAKPAKKKAAAKKSPAKKTGRPSATRTKTANAKPARPAPLMGVFTAEDIALRAYFIGEHRRHRGLPGTPESDWFEAERQLRG